MMAWRQATCGDVDAIAAVAERVHADYPERREVFVERVALFAQGCFVLESETGIAGYALAHPWRMGEAVALDTLIGAIPEGASCLYLHDAALLPQARGQGHSRALVSRLDAVARQAALPRICLTAIDGASALWEALGFRSVDDPALAARLASYGGGATYMTRETG